MVLHTPTIRDDLVGSVIAQRYQITAVIGEGGMARVYRAEDRLLGRTVALKVLRQGADTASDLERQQAEIELLATLEHPALVTLFDVVPDTEHPDRVVLVMQHVEGETLGARLARDGALTPRLTAAVGADIASGLAYVHARGIVHRDVKPANILLSSGPETTAVLSDFGIARLAEAAAGLTSTGTIIGTAHYLSPEQARGGTVTPASDVYSLGLVLIECLTGRRCFAGSAIESATARLTRDPELPQAGGAWTDLLAGMTAREPGERPAASHVAAQLRAMDADVAAAVATTPQSAETATTRVLPASAPSPAPPAAVAASPPLPQTTPAPDKRAASGKRVGIALAVAAVIASAAGVGWWATAALQAPAPATVEYTPVEGPLGEQLERLQEAVEP